MLDGCVAAGIESGTFFPGFFKKRGQYKITLINSIRYMYCLIKKIKNCFFIYIKLILNIFYFFKFKIKQFNNYILIF